MDVRKDVRDDVRAHAPGVLYIVATPIGNLKDITLRAIETLMAVDLIAAEDTRHSKTLLQHYAIATPTISLHDYNEERRSQLLVAELKKGKNLALISDAGTPLISDPGYRLARLAREENIKVVAVPGACAAIAALSVAGLATDHFVFEGFLPTKRGALEGRLRNLVAETRTTIIYESTHRLLQLLDTMGTVLGQERKIVLAKELTKTFENVIYGTIGEVRQWLVDEAVRQKGEFVLLVEGVRCACERAQMVHNSNENSKQEDLSLLLDAESSRVLHILLKKLPELSTKQVVNIAAEITGASKRALYQAALNKKPHTHEYA
jgi:16S rRNA (cytidine1402-2'-O)-methyltransferase